MKPSITSSKKETSQNEEALSLMHFQITTEEIRMLAGLTRLWFPKAICRTVKSDKHRASFGELLDQLSSQEVSVSNIVHDFIEVKKESAGQKLASDLLAGKRVNGSLEDYIKWTSTSDLEEASEDEVLEGTPVSDLFSTAKSEGLIKIYPRSLGERLDGGLCPGHHLIIFARPEMGKTLFAVNMVFGFLKQDLRVLYLGNEEPLKDISSRLVTRMTGLTKWEILDNVDGADSTARASGYENVVFVSLAPGTVRQIDSLILKYKPNVVVLDQVRNVAVDEDGRTNQLDRAAAGFRNLGKKHNILAVSITQAGDSASGKGVLDMSDIDSSKTGIPASCDVLIGIGASREDEARNRRIISICKNKRNGIHDSFPVLIDPTTSKVKSI